ncbi:hypothetical protein JCM10213_005684 [Rhodosporidiobolus nylandii]
MAAEDKPAAAQAEPQGPSTEEEYVPWAKREGWEDLQPVPQADAPNCLVPIAYDIYYRDAMDTFRAMVAKKEKSKRTIELTEDIVQMNPGHYSVWKYRCDTLLALGGDLTEELTLLDDMVKYHLKSYQVWQHRRQIVLALKDPSRELDFTAKALAIDAKNYHTWAYRQWALCHFWGDRSFSAEELASRSSEKTKEAEKVWQGELEYVEQLLAEDIRNNSAWNHRFFVAFESGMGGEGAGEREIQYAKTKLAISPNNPSAWNYLRGILARLSLPLSSIVPFAKPLALNDLSLLPSSEPEISKGAELPAWLAIEFLADAAAEEVGKLSGEEKKAKAEEASALFLSLVEFDPIRRFYWTLRSKEALAAAK